MMSASDRWAIRKSILRGFVATAVRRVQRTSFYRNELRSFADLLVEIRSVTDREYSGLLRRYGGRRLEGQSVQFGAAFAGILVGDVVFDVRVRCDIWKDLDRRFPDVVDWTPEAWLVRLDVRPAFRRLGIGQRLTRQVLARARGLGFSYVLLDVNVRNRPAIDLYLREGFKVTATTCSGQHRMRRDL